MGDQDMDPCECVFNYDVVSRLLSLLRQSQAYCTDNECLTLDNLPGFQENSSMPDLFIIGIAFVVIFVLYLSRPNSLRASHYANEKGRKDSSDSHDPPAPPPPSMN